jgi:glycosyltransferase involved in cell wall biosynthesis
MSGLTAIALPKLSIVIASQNAHKSIGKCLFEIESQVSGNEIEIIVVDNSTDETADIIVREFPQVKLIRSSKEKLIPELWGIGINQSEGIYIALTTAHFIPSKTWIAEIIKAQDSDYAGIGGAIENDEQAGLVSWAVYFCRYARYMLPFAQEAVDDFAADNASYKRADLDRVRQALQKGFWEVFVHNEMRRAKMSLFLTPAIVVYHKESFTFTSFMNQRFWHGRQFGKSRAQTFPAFKRTVFVMLSPLIPFIYLYRITGRVFSKKEI